MKTEAEIRAVLDALESLLVPDVACEATLQAMKWVLGEKPPAEPQKTEREIQLEQENESLRTQVDSARETIMEQHAALREKGSALGLAQQELERLKAGPR